MLEKRNWFNNTGAIDMKMYGSVLEEKSSWDAGVDFLLDWGSYIISIAKTAFKKIGDLICSRKFLSPEIALHLYKSAIWSSYKNGYAGLLVLHLLLLLNPWFIVEMWPA